MLEDKIYPKKINVNGYIYRRIKHPDLPKKYKNQYQMFVQDYRKIISAKYPNEHNTEILKILSIEWKNIDSKVLENYDAIAEKNREEYFKKLQEYTGEMYTYVRCNKKHKHFGNEKRALSPYNKFLSKEIQKLKIEYPNKPHKEIFITATKNWNLYKENKDNSGIMLV